MPPTEIDEAAARVQAGCPTDRTGAGIPGRFGIRTQRSSGPQRSVSDPGKQNASATCIFRLCCRKTREKREGERRSPSGRRIHPEAYRTPGDRTGNAAGERSERPRVRLGLAEPESEEARATGLRAVRVGLSRQKRRASPEHLPNPITYFVTPAVLGGVFGSYFPIAGNPLAWSRLENTCTWHIRYINAYDRSAKYFSIPKPG